jgi:hypothetical protein
MGSIHGYTCSSRYGCPFGNGFCSRCSHYELGECRARGLLGGCEYLHLDTCDGQMRRIPSQAPYGLAGGARNGCCPNASPRIRPGPPPSRGGRVHGTRPPRLGGGPLDKLRQIVTTGASVNLNHRPAHYFFKSNPCTSRRGPPARVGPAAQQAPRNCSHPSVASRAADRGRRWPLLLLPSPAPAAGRPAA